jgi:hypothetical protein
MKYALVLALLIAPYLAGQTAGEIMARVAENQDRAERLRSKYVYRQTVSKIVRFTNGKIDNEEYREYEVIPTPTGVERKLVSRNGGAREISMQIDKTSRDGIGSRLFPLTGKEQANYSFKLLGRQTLQGRDVFKIAFTPRNDDATCWAGNAFIDGREYQPVLVETRLATHIPFAARALLGINLKDLGFTLAYQKFDDGVWFPVSFEGDFLMRVFFVRRKIEMALKNSDFKKTDVQTNVSFEQEAAR